MRKFFALAILLASPFVYAGEPSYMLPAYPASTNWQGFYAGADVGLITGTTNYNVNEYFNQNPGYTTTANQYSASSPTGGLHVGYNLEYQNFVVGPEVNFDFMNQSYNANNIGGGNSQFNSYWISTYDARFGYAFYQLLFYGVGGFALNDTQETITPPKNNGTNTVTSNNTMYGWVVGGGLDWQLARHWSIDIQYVYASMSSPSSSSSASSGVQNASANGTISQTDNLVTLGFSYIFNM